MKTSRLALAALAALSFGCDETRESIGASAFALVRIGGDHLPVRLSPSEAYPLLLADTLYIPVAPEFTLTWVEVIAQQPLEVDRSSTRHAGSWTDSLTFDSCPIEALCIASLVYAPMVFDVVGDSLFQRVSASSPVKPRVYARVVKSGRPR